MAGCLQGFCREPCSERNRLFYNQSHSERRVHSILWWIDSAQSFTITPCPGRLNTLLCSYKQSDVYKWGGGRFEEHVQLMYAEEAEMLRDVQRWQPVPSTLTTKRHHNNLQSDLLHRQFSCTTPDKAGRQGGKAKARQRGRRRCVQPPVWRCTAWGLIPVEWTEI